jgi:hypothetical protein
MGLKRSAAPSRAADDAPDLNASIHKAVSGQDAYPTEFTFLIHRKGEPVAGSSKSFQQVLRVSKRLLRNMRGRAVPDRTFTPSGSFQGIHSHRAQRRDVAGGDCSLLSIGEFQAKVLPLA